jgi:preprotein translocase subunit YajC
MSLIPSAFAAGTTEAAAGGASSFMSFLPMIVIFALFWLLLIRPQQKKAKAHNQMLAALEKGSEVLTNGGIIGTITDINEQFVHIKVSDGVVMKFQRGAISGKIDSNNVVTKAK